MSGLTVSLANAARALEAQQYGLGITGQNIANLNTDGYSRRIATLQENKQGGVEIQGAPAQRDAYIDGRLRNELPAEARDGAVADSLSVVQTTLGASGGSVDAQLSAFFAAWQALAASPTSSGARSGVVVQGQQLANALNDMSSRLDDSIRSADNQIIGGVTQINALATEIASLNRSIGDANGADVEGLKDRQNVLLQSLNKLVNTTVVPRSEGGMDVTIGTSGHALVLGATAYAIDATQKPPSGLTSITSHGQDITSELSGGQIGGWLQVRDTLVPAYKSQLDTIAYTLVQQVNAVHSTGYGLDGVTGRNFFTPLATASGAAAAMAVAPGVIADANTVAASSTGTTGDNQTATALAALGNARVVNGTSTFVDAWGQLVYQAGSDARQAQSNQKSRQSIIDSVRQLRDSISGVSLDDEAGQMLMFQRAYQANAKYFSTVNTVLDSLLALVS